MIILVISQRAIPTPDYNLKDLTGHGRFDIIPRCILATSRKIILNNTDAIYIFMKGGESGWIHWINESNPLQEDEISIAAELKNNWSKYFTKGNLTQLLETVKYDSIYLLSESGDLYKSDDLSKSIVILGAQRDLTDDDHSDIAKFGNFKTISLGEESMLASHAIILLRQKIFVNSLNI